VNKSFSTVKRMIFSVIALLFVFSVANVIVWLVCRSGSVFWQNPLMVMYPVDSFNESATVEHYNFNKDPNRPVKYVPDPRRWYRLSPEPLIPEDGDLILNFGDSSTWGWGLENRGDAYPLELDRVRDGVHSINLGVPGYSSLQGLRYMEELLPKYRNRIRAVTIYFGNNDSTENGSSDSSKLKKEIRSWVKMVRWFPVGRVTHDALVRIAQRNNRNPRVSPEEYEVNLRGMVALAREYHIPVVLIEPPRHFSWQPAHLTYLSSLEERVQNRWVKSELELASRSYAQGLDYIYRATNEYHVALVDALNHDWVVPRIKTDWLDRLRRVSESESVVLVTIPEFWILAEQYAFEDYCHPSARAHLEIARGIKLALGLRP
jgi:lysophospholipase L1-like esterase